jgi:hypothetical protein
MSRTSLRSNTDLPPPSDRRIPRPSRGNGWNALADIEVFVFAVEAYPYGQGRGWPRTAGWWHSPRMVEAELAEDNDPTRAADQVAYVMRPDVETACCANRAAKGRLAGGH